MGSSVSIAGVVIILAIILFVLTRLSTKSVIEREGRKFEIVSLDDESDRCRVLSCSELGLCGKPDRILKDCETGEYIVEEVKKRPYLGKVFNGEKIQLLSYVLLVRENYGKCNRGYLVYRDDVRVGPFVLDRQAETLVRWGIERVKEIKQGKVPKRRYTNRCKVCSYRKECFGMKQSLLPIQYGRYGSQKPYFKTHQ